jgi:hypothetical protein
LLVDPVRACADAAVEVVARADKAMAATAALPKQATISP